MKKLFPILFLAAFCTVSAGAQQFELSYRLAKDTYKFKQLEETNALGQTNDGRTTEINRKTTRYVTVEIESVGANGISYRSVQDTAIVEESTTDPRIQQQNLIVQNILTGKPVLVRQSPSGLTMENRALQPLNASRMLGPSANDAMFTPRAVILPILPTRPLEVGMRWTETHADTLNPSKTIPQYGTGNGVRYLQSSTEYVVEELQEVAGKRCVKISWKGLSSMEEKLIFSRLEEYNEETTKSSGEMLVEIDSGLPRHVDVYADKEATRAFFGGESSVIPTSINTHTVLDLISH
ncbi:hypothetical protein KQI65_04320 [bacterium]|nr:hypothetical protein [bacterium]